MSGSWAPDQYLKFEEHRTRPARDLLNGIDLAAPKLIYDLGCGPGNSTALLRQRWPDAVLIGIDSDAAMLDKAHCEYRHLNAQWIEQKIENFAPAEPADLIYSNAALHWVPDHEHLLPRLFSYLRPGGVLAFQVPNNFNAPSHIAVKELCEAEPWKSVLKGAPIVPSIDQPEQYFASLHNASRAIDIWQTEYVHVLYGNDAVFEWLKGSTLTPLMPHLDARHFQEFSEALKVRLRMEYPPLKHQATAEPTITLFPFKRLFLVVKNMAPSS